jgi:hypothetical protein
LVFFCGKLLAPNPDAIPNEKQLNKRTIMPLLPITTKDVRNAEQNIKGITVVTPLLENQTVNELLGGRLLIKAENLQLTGAFKIRGAYNRLFYMSEKEQKNGCNSLLIRQSRLGSCFRSKSLWLQCNHCDAF